MIQFYIYSIAASPFSLRPEMPKGQPALSVNLGGGYFLIWAI